MMRIETARLLIYPGSNDDMKQLIDAEQNAELKQAYSEMLKGCMENPEHRQWYTLWFIELKEQPYVIVGDLSFKGLNPDGMVELGYGLRDGYCGKGYMTEAVRAITQWALKQSNVSRVEAETEPDNIASQNVLINTGYIQTGHFGHEGPRYLYKNQLMEN